MEDLSRFLEAQQSAYLTALKEIRNGKKQGHWIWFIFPQISGLGLSSTSAYYAIANIQHADQYFRHPVLGKRLIEIAEAILAVDGKSAYQIFGSPDDMKLRSSMTLFSLLEKTDRVFQAVLDKYFDGKPDQRTMDLAYK